MQINKSLSTEENLIALIIDANPGKELKGNQIAIGAPVETDTQSGFNTSVKVSAVAGAGFAEGSVTFRYNRVDLESFIPWQILTVEEGISADDLLKKVVDDLSIPEGLMHLDVVSFNAPDSENPGAPGTFVVKGNAYSLFFTTGEKMFPVMLAQSSDPSLTDTFTVTDLNGFEAQ